MPAKRILLLAVVVVILAIGAFAFVNRPMSFRPAVLKDMTTVPAPATGQMQFEVVTSPDKQELGLGNRANIPDNYGMLFVFPKDDRYGFWMKDMLVPIDMIWLSDNGDIILIDSSVEPDTYPHVFYPPQPVKYVVETKAGFAAEHGWTVGTHVPLPAPYGT